MSRLPQVIPRIPEPVRVVLRNAVWAYGRATAGSRPLPDFLILGAQKAGTTALYDYLHAQGILANVHYIPVHRLPFYKRRGWAKKRLPAAEAFYAGALSLPMHAALSDADVRRVIAAVRKGLDLAL